MVAAWGFVWDVGVFGMLGLVVLVVLDLSLVWIGCLFLQVRPGMTDLDGKDHHLFNMINRDCSTLEQKLIALLLVPILSNIFEVVEKIGVNLPESKMAICFKMEIHHVQKS